MQGRRYSAIEQINRDKIKSPEDIHIEDPEVPARVVTRERSQQADEVEG